MRKLILLLVIALITIAFLWIFVKPVAEAFCIGILIGALVWGIKRLMTKD